MSKSRYLRFALSRQLFFVLEQTPEGFIISAYSSCSLLSSVFCESALKVRVRWMEATGENLAGSLIGEAA